MSDTPHLTDIMTAAKAAEILTRLRKVHTQAVEAEWTWVEVARADAADLMTLLEAIMAAEAKEQSDARG